MWRTVKDVEKVESDPMNPTALLMMVSTILVVTAVTGYFFVRVLTVPPKPEPDSYAENDDEPVREQP